MKNNQTHRIGTGPATVRSFTRIAFTALAALLLAVVVADGQSPLTVNPVPVLPAAETEPAHSPGDTADDSAIWINPNNPELSLIIGNDKHTGDGGLMVWDLDGHEVQFVPGMEHDNLDLRYDFPLVGQFADGTPHTAVDLIAVSLEEKNSIGFYKINPTTLNIEFIGMVYTSPFLLSDQPHGGCLYRSNTGAYYFFSNGHDYGETHQYQLFDAGDGTVGMKLVRKLQIGSATESCVVDDELGFAYFDEEVGNLWRYGADPGAGENRTLVEKPMSEGGRIAGDGEGLAIYHLPDGRGYLLQSDQGVSTFHVYRRDGNNEYLGSFTIAATKHIDEVSETDGIEVTNAALGGAFPTGLFVAHDHKNNGAKASNLKLVSWDSIASALSLDVDTSWNSREVPAVSSHK